MVDLRNRPTLARVVGYWPSVVFVPTILLVIAMLAHLRDHAAPAGPQEPTGDTSPAT